MSQDSEFELLGSGKFIRLVRHGKWEFVQRNRSTGVVAIVPVTASREVVVVEQFRPPLGKRVIEFPAGLAGDIEGAADELLETAAARELEEETGYQAKELQYLVTIPSSAGLTDESITMFLATEINRVGSGGGVDGEDIVTHRIPLDEIDQWLANQIGEGKLIESRVYVGLYFIRTHLG